MDTSRTTEGAGEPGRVPESLEWIGRVVLGAWLSLSVLALLGHLVLAIATGVRGPARVERSVGDLAGLVEQIHERVDDRETILVDTWQAPLMPADHYLERELSYWVFPRPVYSAAALRERGTSLEPFVAERDIRWLVRGRELLDLRDHPDIDGLVTKRLAPPKPAPGAVARSMQPFGPLVRPSLSRWGLVLLGVCVHLAGGWGLLVVMGLANRMAGRTELVGWSWLLGLALSSVTALCWFLAGHTVTPLGPMLPHVILAVTGGLTAWRFGPHRRPVPTGESHDSRTSRLSWLMLVMAGVVIVLAAWRGIDGFDQRMQWGFKARLMQSEPGPWGESVFQDRDHVHFHPRYPLLVPAAEAIFGGLGGGGDAGTRGFSESAAVMIFPLTWLALGGVVIGGLERLGSRDPVRGGILVLLMPAWSGLGAFQNNLATFNGCPELIVGAALLAAVVAMLSAHREGGDWWALVGICLLMAGLSKAEGAVAVAVLAGVALVATTTAGQRGILVPSLAVVAVVGGTLLAHELVFTRGVVGGILPDDYRELLTVAGVLDGMTRLPHVASELAIEAVVAPWFGAVGACLVYAVWASRGRWRVPAVRWPLVTTLLMLAAYCVPFLVIPDFENNLDWAAGRLLMEVAPLAAWSLAVILDGGVAVGISGGETG